MITIEVLLNGEYCLPIEEDPLGPQYVFSPHQQAVFPLLLGLRWAVNEQLEAMAAVSGRTYAEETVTVIPTNLSPYGQMKYDIAITVKLTQPTDMSVLRDHLARYVLRTLFASRQVSSLPTVAIIVKTEESLGVVMGDSGEIKEIWPQT